MPEMRVQYFSVWSVAVWAAPSPFRRWMLDGRALPRVFARLMRSGIVIGAPSWVAGIMWGSPEARETEEG